MNKPFKTDSGKTIIGWMVFNKLNGIGIKAFNAQSRRAAVNFINKKYPLGLITVLYQH